MIAVHTALLVTAPLLAQSPSTGKPEPATTPAAPPAIAPIPSLSWSLIAKERLVQEVAQGYGPISAMPAMGTVLTPREVRDVVAH
jgi:hypothetical protein